MWFEQLTEFAEKSPPDVRARLRLSGTTLSSLENARTWTCGTLEIVSLLNLRTRAEQLATGSLLRVTEEIADIQDLHANPIHEGAHFQVAS